MRPAALAALALSIGTACGGGDALEGVEWPITTGIAASCTSPGGEARTLVALGGGGPGHCVDRAAAGFNEYDEPIFEDRPIELTCDEITGLLEAEPERCEFDWDVMGSGMWTDRAYQAELWFGPLGEWPIEAEYQSGGLWDCADSFNPVGYAPISAAFFTAEHQSTTLVVADPGAHAIIPGIEMCN